MENNNNNNMIKDDENDDENEIKYEYMNKKSEAEELQLYSDMHHLSGDAADDDIDDDTDLTDEPCELGDNIDIYYQQTHDLMTIESDSELPENITLLPSKADNEAFADLYDPQLVVQNIRKRRCINCLIL
eukprot:456294_1